MMMYGQAFESESICVKSRLAWTEADRPLLAALRWCRRRLGPGMTILRRPRAPEVSAPNMASPATPMGGGERAMVDAELPAVTAFTAMSASSPGMVTSLLPKVSRLMTSCVGGKEKQCLSILFKIKGPSKAGRVIKLDLEDF